MNYDSNDFIDISFGEDPFEQWCASLEDAASAAMVLTLLEGESEETLRQALDHLADFTSLDISDLPRATVKGASGERLHREEKLAKTGDFLADLEETDPLRLYLEELAMIPAFGDIRVLAEELAQSNLNGKVDEALWSQILNLSLSRVVDIAKEFTGYGVLLLDLIQEGSMGLWEHLDGYVYGDIEVFIDWQIRQAMARAVTVQAHAAGVGSHMRQAMEDYRNVDERLLTELGRNPTLEEIAEELHMSESQAAVVAEMVNNARNMNRAKAEQESPEETEDDERHVEDTAYFQMRQRIEELLSSLSEREAKVLTLRFGLEGGLPMDAVQTGAKLGMTADEVVKTEAAALMKLRS